MKTFHISLFLCANFVAAAIAYYRKCYDECSVCLITNTDDPLFQSKFKRTRFSAEVWCKEKSSSLATIANETVQSALEAFIGDSSAKLNTHVITNAYRYNLTSWQWTHMALADMSNNSYNDRYGYGFLVSKPQIYLSFDRESTSKRKFICSCTSNNMRCPEDYQQSGRRCYKIHKRIDTWFGARSTCLREEGSDLATFENGFGSTVENWSLNGEYWIGLQRERWFWLRIGFSGDIKYSNWDDDKPGVSGGSCLCLDVRNGKWRDCECYLEYRYICIQDYVSGSASNAASSTSKTTTLKTTTLKTIQSMTTTIRTVGGSLHVSHFQSTPTHITDDNSRNKMSVYPPNTSNTSGLLPVIGIGIACLLIIVIVIALVAFLKIHCRNSPTMVTNDVPSAVYPLVMPYTGEQARSSSERTSCEIVYEELVPNGDRRLANGRSSPESEYTRLQLGSEYTRLQLGSEYTRLQRDSAYANSAQTRV